ncbi:MAG: hypothetical protein CHACPFDD_03574 [Phycisphaerae bacterium]|nr:hypothetical protein [Phycisphaerae bacterium]
MVRRSPARRTPRSDTATLRAAPSGHGAPARPTSAGAARPTRLTPLVAVLALALAALDARAEEADVILKSGRKYHGDVTQTETHVVITTPAGALRVEKSEVLSIVPRVTDDDEYRQRVAKLDARDLDGHFAVAEWARSRQRWDLVTRQCRYILSLDANHRKAKILLEEALAKAVDQEAARAGDSEADGAESGASDVPLLTEREITRLKMLELSADRVEEQLRVRFIQKRGQKGAEEQYVGDMRASKDEAFDAESERTFSKKPPQEKLADIARKTGSRYADLIEISGDPEVFATFRRKILPLISRGCSRSGCHGSQPSGEFRFPAGSRQNEAVAYTVFAVLDRTRTAAGPLLNRDDPSNSVLLDFMLPPKEANRPHPDVGPGRKLTPIVKSTSDRNYQMVLDWINSLRVPHPDYQLAGAAHAPPASQPHSQPASAPRP